MEELARKAVLLYNRVRSPEVTAKLVSASPASVTVSFSGGFCYGCGVLDYVEGFANQFKALTDKAELKVGKTRQINPRTFQADYTTESKKNCTRPLLFRKTKCPHTKRVYSKLSECSKLLFYQISTRSVHSSEVLVFC